VGCVVSTQEIAALKELKMKHLTSWSAFWTDICPHPRIADGREDFKATMPQENTIIYTLRKWVAPFPYWKLQLGRMERFKPFLLHYTNYIRTATFKPKTYPFKFNTDKEMSYHFVECTRFSVRAVGMRSFTELLCITYLQRSRIPGTNKCFSASLRERNHPENR
jgi:hypothetical protein